MLMIVQIALGIVLAVLILLLLFKLWGVVLILVNKVSDLALLHYAMLSCAFAIFLGIFGYKEIAAVGILIGVIALVLSAIEALPRWLIKLLESLFWLFCSTSFASVLLSDYSTEQNSLLWTVVAFLVISVLMFLRSLTSVKALLRER